MTRSLVGAAVRTACLIVLVGAAAPLRAQTRFAVIGDFGSDSSDEGAVASLVASWNPDFVATVGDNRYGSRTFDQTVGKYYCAFMKDARAGTYCNGGTATQNRFFPAPGNHEYTDGLAPDDNGIGGYVSYFTLPGTGYSSTSGNERYYDFAIGNLHVFVINSYSQELDGTSSSSTQAQWLQGRLAASTADFNIVLLHHAPYSSGSHGSSTYMRWPFAAWGADAVLAGHDHTYERLSVDGIPYFVNGLGGYTTYGFGTALPETQFRYNADFGAMLVEATSTEVRFRFINVSGTTIDDFTYVPGIVPNARPVADARVTPPVGAAPLAVAFDGSYSSDGDGSVVDYAWTFGDGATASGVSAAHTYASNGTYTATLTVTDNDGATDQETFQIQVVNPGSNVSLTLRSGQNGYQGATDTKIKSDASTTNFGADPSMEADGSPDYAVLLGWDVSDLPAGSVIESASIVLTVSNPTVGSYAFYEVKRPWIEMQATWVVAAAGTPWSVAGANGTSDRGTIVLAPAAASTTGVKTYPLGADGVALVQRWLDDPGSNAGVILLNYDETDGIDFASREDQVVTNRPVLALTITTPQAGDLPPTAVATASPLSGNAPLTVQFDASTSTDDGGIVSYGWDFGDGATGNGLAPSHTYAASGTFTATLTVTDGGGQTDTDQVEITVSAPPATWVYVASLSTSATGAPKGKRAGTASILIVDSNGLPVTGALVIGDFGGDISQTDATGTTGTDGIASLTSSVTTGNKNPSISFCVSSVVASLPYDPTQNASDTFACGGGGTPPGYTYVAAVVTGTAGAGKGQKYGTADVTIRGEFDNVFEGIPVKGYFSGDVTHGGIPAEATTGADGVARFRSSDAASGKPVVNFCVSEVLSTPPVNASLNASLWCGAAGASKFGPADAPAAFGLDQNYPNPFNPSTQLTFTVSEAAPVTLSVFNLMGQEVARLVDRVVEPGVHSVRFDATELSAGTYLVVLKAGMESRSRPITLMK